MQPNSASNGGKTYRSSFRTNKHEYNFLTTLAGNLTLRQKQGIALSELLNIYYFLPSWAEGNGSKYQITDGIACQWIGKGNMYNSFDDLSDAQSLIDFWGGQAEQLLQSGDHILSYDKYSSEDMMKVIVENIKRRMPVLAFTDADSYLIYSYDESTGKLGLFGTDGNKTDGYLQNYDFTIVDTGKYFNLLRSGMYISDEQSGNANTKTVTISLPDGYTDDSVQSYKKVGNAYETMAYTSFANGAVSYQAGQDAEFVVSVRVAFDGITPDCYNATRNYIIKIYPDVSDGQWFASYVFDLSNKGFLVGGENNGVFGFWPDDPITIAEFLTVLYRAADVSAEIYNSQTGETGAVVPYDKTMADHAMQEQWINNEQYQQVLYGIGNQPVPEGEQIRGIRREEAADMLWKVFRSDECRVPHQLHEYDLTSDFRSEAWTNYADYDNFSNTGYRDSFHQLFLNGVIAGYADYGENEEDMLLPQETITRAETCKIVSKALYSLAEIGTTLDPVWDKSNIEELKLGETKSGDLSSYGGKNYWFEADKAGYYMVSTSADKYALYDADGTRQEPVAEKDGKDVYMVTKAQELRLYTAGASGASVATTVEHAPSGYIAPQEVVFEQPTTIIEDGITKNCYYIFDDHPEYIRPCDILDPNEGNPVALSHNTELGIGKYTVFSYHHKDEEMFNKTSISFNSVFYATGEQYGKVNKIGFRHGNDWPDYQGAWLDFDEGQNASNYKNIGVEREVWGNDSSTYGWLDEDYLVNPNTIISDSADASGVVWLLMEFEVTKGTVNFATVAYKTDNISHSDNILWGKKIFNDWNDTGSITSYYEDLATLKGMGATTMSIYAAPLEYIVDASTPDGYLPFYISNQLFEERQEADHFSTNIAPYTANNRWTTPLSNVVPITFNGPARPADYTDKALCIKGIEENETNHRYTTEQLPKTWIFDSLHSKYTSDLIIPEDSRIGPYSQKEYMLPNEQFNADWLKMIVHTPKDCNFDIENWKIKLDKKTWEVIYDENGLPVKEERAGYNTMCNYAVTQIYPITIINTAPFDRTLKYTMAADIHQRIEYSVNGGSVVKLDSSDWNKENKTFTFEVNIPAGQTTTINLETTMMTAAIPVQAHWFYLY